MKRILVRLSMTATAMAVTVAMAGCGLAAEKAAEKVVGDALGAKVDKDGENVTISTDQGAMTTGKDLPLPDGWPKDVPVAGDARINSVIEGEVSGVKTYTIVYLSGDEPGALYDELLKAVQDGGWKVLMSVTPDQGGYVSAEKDSLLVNLTVSATTEDGAKSSVTTIVGPTANP